MTICASRVPVPCCKYTRRTVVHPVQQQTRHDVRALRNGAIWRTTSHRPKRQDSTNTQLRIACLSHSMSHVAFVVCTRPAVSGRAALPHPVHSALPSTSQTAQNRQLLARVSVPVQHCAAEAGVVENAMACEQDPLATHTDLSSPLTPACSGQQDATADNVVQRLSGSGCTRQFFHSCIFS